MLVDLVRITKLPFDDQVVRGNNYVANNYSVIRDQLAVYSGHTQC